MEREERTRLAESYVATRDAVGVVLNAALGGRRQQLPWYVRPEGGARGPGLTGAALEAAVDQLARKFPGRVRDVN